MQHVPEHMSAHMFTRARARTHTHPNTRACARAWPHTCLRTRKKGGRFAEGVRRIGRRESIALVSSSLSFGSISPISASPTASSLRGYRCADTQNHGLGESFLKPRSTCRERSLRTHAHSAHPKKRRSVRGGRAQDRRPRERRVFLVQPLLRPDVRSH